VAVVDCALIIAAPAIQGSHATTRGSCPNHNIRTARTAKFISFKRKLPSSLHVSTIKLYSSTWQVWEHISHRGGMPTLPDELEWLLMRLGTGGYRHGYRRRRCI